MTPPIESNIAYLIISQYNHNNNIIVAEKQS